MIDKSGHILSTLVHCDFRYHVDLYIWSPRLLTFSTFIVNESIPRDFDLYCLIPFSSRLSGDCSEGGRAYYAYVAEGLSTSLDWQEVMKHQKRNGSLFNSPSTTASAVIHTQDEKALNYLRSLLQKFGNSGASRILIRIELYRKLYPVQHLMQYLYWLSLQFLPHILWIYITNFELLIISRSLELLGILVTR